MSPGLIFRGIIISLFPFYQNNTNESLFMKIATYNINGMNARLPVLLKWLSESKPDIACLQELKMPQENFPDEVIKNAGYDVVWRGQKSWNGVAVLSKGRPVTEITRTLPGDAEDEQSRYLEASIGDLTIVCLYLPNGNPAPGPKFDYKLKWFDRFNARAKELFSSGKPVILTGDYNVIPTEFDVYKIDHVIKDALFLPETREAFQKLVGQGWTDAIRKLYPDEKIYTYWDFFRNAYNRNAGMRIDHFLLSPQIDKKLVAGGVDKEVRGWEKTSDHAPVWIEIAGE